jgi:peptidoglycan/LPS O-acetylase OafA/YrhL
MTARVDSLTGFRFLAAGAVLLHHTLAPTLLSQGLVHLPGTRRLAVVGYVGVTAFFVLSGFVLAWSWDDRRTRSGFYGRRFARVWPLHALTFLAVVAFVEPVVGGVGGTSTSAGRAVAGLALVHGWVPQPLWYFAGNGPSWSLSCEAFFYALLPFLVPVLRRSGRRAAAVTVVASFAGLLAVPLLLRATTDGTYTLLSLAVFPGYRVGEFLIGVVLGWAVRGGWRPAWSLAQAAVLTGAAYLAAAWLAGPVFFSDVRRDRALGNLYADLFVVLPVAALLAALATRDLEGRPTWLARPLPVLLGGASFAFYLVHVPVIQLLGEIPREDRSVGRGLPALVVATGLSLLLALVLHRFVERPAERALRRRVERREAARSDALARGVSWTTGPRPEERAT